MGNINCRRFDILLANLNEEGIEKEHYILCVSNWKNNIKSDSINAIFISSKLKKHPSHIFFQGEKYGLNKESVIKCEKLFTVKKDKIIKKAGHISDIYIQLEVEKGLECQLQLDEKYTNNDIEQLQGLFKGRVAFMDDISSYNLLKCKIRDNAYSEEYCECIGNCTKLIELVRKDKLIENKDFLHYAYYHRGLMYKKLEEYNQALLDSKESLKYVGNLKMVINNNYSYSMWAIASAYESLNNLDSSEEIYLSLSKYYKNIGKINMRIAMLFNIAKQKNRLGMMKRLMKILEYIEFEEYETNGTKENLLNEMKKDINMVKTNLVS